MLRHRCTARTSLRHVSPRMISTTLDVDVFSTQHGAVDENRLEERISCIARRANVDLGWLERIASERPVMYDTAGSYACRVVDASRRRQVMHAAAEVFNKLGAGASLDDLSGLSGLSHLTSAA